jgi:hypothetical protein
MQQVGGYIDPSTTVHPHLYLPLPTRSPLYKVTAVTPPHTLMSSASVHLIFIKLNISFKQ